jgi:hypothetical protein
MDFAFGHAPVSSTIDRTDQFSCAPGANDKFGVVSKDRHEFVQRTVALAPSAHWVLGHDGI